MADPINAPDCIPAPIQTPMFTGESVDNPATWADNKNRGLCTPPWIAFFTQFCRGIFGLLLGEREIVFNLAAGDLPVALGTFVTPPRLAMYQPNMQILEIATIARDAPTGADLIMDVCINGATILDGSKLTIPDGSSGITTVTSFAANPTIFKYHDRFSIDVLQIGSTYAGRAIFIGIRYRIGIGV